MLFLIYLSASAYDTEKIDEATGLKEISDYERVPIIISFDFSNWLIIRLSIQWNSQALCNNIGGIPQLGSHGCMIPRLHIHPEFKPTP